jgi:hypothetical protein
MVNYSAAKEISGTYQAVTAGTGATQVSFRYGNDLFKNTQAYVSCASPSDPKADSLPPI